MSRLVLDILRRAKEPLTTQEVSKEIMRARGLDISDAKLLRKMVKRAGMTLRAQRENGLIQSKDGGGLYMVWEVVR